MEKTWKDCRATKLKERMSVNQWMSACRSMQMGHAEVSPGVEAWRQSTIIWILGVGASWGSVSDVAVWSFQWNAKRIAQCPSSQRNHQSLLFCPQRWEQARSNSWSRNTMSILVIAIFTIIISTLFKTFLGVLDLSNIIATSHNSPKQCNRFWNH